MYLCYVDESGQTGKYFVLTGVVVYEKRIYWASSAIDKLQERFLPDIKEPVEFHASPIRARMEPPWNKLSPQQSKDLLDAIYKTIQGEGIYLFSTVVERAWLRQKYPSHDEYGFAVDDLISRFDKFLRWRHGEEGTSDRGLIVIAQSQFQQRIESVAKRIKESGTRWGGEAGTLAEIPLFTLSANSRMLQIADCCANAVWGRYEKGLARHFDTIAPKFFKRDQIIHGLSHCCLDYIKCTCPGCLSRRRLESQY